MTRRKAAVQSVTDLASRGNVRFGKRGGLMRSRIDGITVCQGSSAAKSRRGVRLTTAALSARSLMNSRRVLILRRCFTQRHKGYTKAQRGLKHAAALCAFA